MKRIYLKYDPEFHEYNLHKNDRYNTIEEARTNAMELYILLMVLQPVLGLEENITQDDKSTLIWSNNSFKERAKKNFVRWQDQFDFEDEYDKYCSKRWDEMPQIDLSHQDYENILKQWEDIKERRPKYLIFELDNSGPLDKITIIEKEQLSDQDYENMKRDHEEYLRWEKARDKYIEAHPDYSDDLWRGPQDDEYDADIAQFLDKD